MKRASKSVLDCISFAYNDVDYLLPIVAFADLGVKAKYQLMPNGPILGTLKWRELSLPLVAPDLSTQSEKNIKRFKFAVMNALFTKAKTPYFAMILNNYPTKLKVRASELSWVDESQNTVLYNKEAALPKELIILDLHKLSQEIEGVVGHKSP